MRAPDHSPSSGGPAVRKDLRRFNSQRIVYETFRIFGSNWVALAAVFTVWGLAVAGSAYFWSGWLLGRPDPSINILAPAYRPIDPGEAWAILIEVTIVFLEAAAIGSTLAGGVAFLAVQQRRGVDTEFSEAFMKGVERYGRVLIGSLVTVFVPTVLLTLPGLLFPVASAQPNDLNLAFVFLFQGVALIVGLAIVVCLFLYMPIVMVENATSFRGLRKSWTMTKGRRGVILGALILLGLAQASVRLAVSVLGGAFNDIYIEIAGDAIFAGITGSWTVIAAGVIYSWIVDSTLAAANAGPSAPFTVGR